MIKINCDLCGKAEEKLFKALIEGVELIVCENCSKFGRVISTVKKPVTPKEIKKQVITEQKEEKIELIVDNYSEIIKKRREAMGLTQKEFASKINEKESLVHKIETGVFTPSISLAKKLEKTLGVKLIEEHIEKFESVKGGKEESFTLGDFINIKNHK